MNYINQNMELENTNMEIAILGAGCFWCVEAVFQRLKGVNEVLSGYTGGHVENPTYKEVCNGTTGHAEVAKITFDPSVISFKELLGVFFKTHDPTTLNRQGNDVGTQYRSAIFPTSEDQEKVAHQVINELTVAGAYDSKIVTTIEKLREFYPAEEYHHNYFNQNGNQPYCAMVVKPKVDKFLKVFPDRVKA